MALLGQLLFLGWLKKMPSGLAIKNLSHESQTFGNIQLLSRIVEH